MNIRKMLIFYVSIDTSFKISTLIDGTCFIACVWDTDHTTISTTTAVMGNDAPSRPPNDGILFGTVSIKNKTRAAPFRLELSVFIQLIIVPSIPFIQLCYSAALTRLLLLLANVLRLGMCTKSCGAGRLTGRLWRHNGFPVSQINYYIANSLQIALHRLMAILKTETRNYTTAVTMFMSPNHHYQRSYPGLGRSWLTNGGLVPCDDVYYLYYAIRIKTAMVHNM